MSSTITPTQTLATLLTDAVRRHGERVAILATTRPEWTYADFAITTAGCVVVPIYPTNSPQECEWVLSDSDAVAVVCENAPHPGEAVEDRSRTTVRLASVRAYKVLIGGRSGFTGWRWPLPEGGSPGEWVLATGRPQLCVNGVHACTVQQLPQWLGEELWTIELDGEILRSDAALVAARARLLGRVEAWSEATRAAFGEDSARRAHGAMVEGQTGRALLDAVDRFAAAGRAGPAGYWAAVLAGERASGRRCGQDYDAAFAEERVAQGRWLESELGPLD